MKKLLLFLIIISMTFTVVVNAKMLAVGGSFGMGNLSNDQFSSDRGNFKYAGFVMVKTPILPLQIKAGVEYNNSNQEDTIIGIPYNSILSNLSYFASADFRYHIIMTPLTPYVGIGASFNSLKRTLKAVSGSATVTSDTTYKAEIGVNGHIGLSIEPAKTFAVFIEGNYGQIFTNDLSDFGNKNIADFGGKAGIIIYFF
ncbi:hypothetical protein DRP44_02415 [candidate division TA06 bacterium]|uniref:Outer membrane protein beta-barrel domain-containing protein n=1 Tax=candidate division TA06 bacterium TaxID=2250710 RepID=A0A660S9H0_UNCT6|nr:MAG: hypothetical protein DRP44_02415 [candidate division TA06 bacterium]